MLVVVNRDIHGDQTKRSCAQSSGAKDPSSSPLAHDTAVPNEKAEESVPKVNAQRTHIERWNGEDSQEKDQRSINLMEAHYEESSVSGTEQALGVHNKPLNKGPQP